MRISIRKEIRVVVGIVSLAIIISACLVIYERNNTKRISGSNIASSTSLANHRDEWKNMAVYHNEKYHYFLMYPSALFVDARVPEKVVFLDAEDIPGRIYVEVQPTEYLKPDDALRLKNFELMNDTHNSIGMYYVVQRRLKIDGHDAITIYLKNKAGLPFDQRQ